MKCIALSANYRKDDQQKIYNNQKRLMSRVIKPTLLRSAATLGLTALLVGCATSATGLKKSRINSVTAPQKLTTAVPAGTVMAVIRYPAYIEEAAEEKFHNLYANRTIGSRSYSDDAGLEEVAAIADIVLVKSNYFAMSIFKELAERMPEHSVLLSPHAIKLDESGKLTSEPMTQAETLPNIVSIDFTAYSFPDAKRMLEGEPVSFGDIITPLVTVRTDHRASAPTQGVLLTSRPTLRGAVANGRQTVAQNLFEFESGKFETSELELDFITMLNNTIPIRVVSQKLSKTASDNTISRLPLEQIRLDGTKIANLNHADIETEDPLEGEFSTSLANQVVGMINKIDIKKATMVNYATAISQFDESLGLLTLIGSTDPDYVTRERYAARLLEAEQNYLSVQSLRLYDGVYNGELGVQVRETLNAEYEVLQKRRDLTRKQNIATGATILKTVAVAAASSATRSKRPQSPEEVRAKNRLIRGLLSSGTNPSSYARRKRLIGNNYFTAILPVIDEQISVQVNLIDSNETITATRYEDLSEQLQTRYQDNHRVSDTIATRCGYIHDGTLIKGIWIGICENGLANGAGMGVLRSNYTSVEYYGYAQNGKPQGAGYLITHGQEGSHTLEGIFDEGLANGVMRVSKAGENNAIRTYRKGRDVGKAPKGQNVISPFDGPT